MKTGIALILFLFFGAFLCFPVVANGGNEGGTIGGGGNSGCGEEGWTLDTCYGAEWRYYETSSDYVTVRGKNNAYAVPTEITGCAESGGYWRYAMVAYGYGYYSNGEQYRPGDQVGTVGISGNSDWMFNSIMLDGVMNYRGNNWEFVKSEYEKARNKYPGIFMKGFEAGSNLSWFCADSPESTTSTHYTSSHTSNYDVSNNNIKHATTGITNISNSRATASITVLTGAKVNLIFSHNIYADQMVNGVSWGVSRTLEKNGSVKDGFSDRAFSIVGHNNQNSNGGISSLVGGIVNITQDRGSYVSPGRYIAQGIGPGTNRPYSDGVNYFVHRDYYTAIFNTEGVYKFCETISLGSTTITGACSEVKVVKKDPGICNAWTPVSYTASNANSGTTSVVSKVKNATLGGDYVDSVYAKPTDNINWVHCYYPGAQRVADSVATQIHGDESDSLPNGSTTANTNILMKEIYNWDNAFGVTSNNLRNPNSTSGGNYRFGTLIPGIYNGGRYAVGASEMKSLTDDTYNVEYGYGKNKAGMVLSEMSRASYPTFASVNNQGIHTWKCNYEQNGNKCGRDCVGHDEKGKCNRWESRWCAWGDCSHSNDYIEHTCYGTDSDSADVIVPYNYMLTSTISLSKEYVYAGETAVISSANVQTRTRSNSVTSGTYATQVDNARIKFVAYLSDNNTGLAKADVVGGRDYDICNEFRSYEACGELSTGSTDFNKGGSLGLGSSVGTVVNEDSILGLALDKYNVFDATAGKYYCVVAAVYPYTSGIDIQMGTDGSFSWYISSPSCAVIAKKPNIEVWGGGLYTTGKISLASAEKRVIDGFVKFTPKNTENTTVFGSWVETNIVANGQVIGLASGAATGYPGVTNRTLLSGDKLLSGSKEGMTTKFCVYRSPLTMPNSDCVISDGIPGVSANGIGSTNAKMNKPVDRDALISRFMKKDSTFKYFNNYTKLSQFINNVIKTNTIPAGQNQTYVLDAKGKTFTIDTNIQYAGGYDNLIDIPKLIIRADNINIECGVTRIDAVLIADKMNSKNNITGVVNTCSNSNNTNDKIRSRQLKINGAVIAGSLKANRTYGAGTGAYSVIPAEIIDYDASLYLWGAPRADASSSGRLDTVYVRELAPRL